MDFNTTLRLLEKEALEKEISEAMLSPQEMLAAKSKQAVLDKFKKAGKLKTGEDIMLDPLDKTKRKWKVIPAQVNKQANSAVLTR